MAYYVVCNGVTPGIYETWDECKKQIMGFPKARYKKFNTLDEAKTAYNTPPKSVARKRRDVTSKAPANTKIISNALSVDAACSGNPGKMEYRGVHVHSKEQWFIKEFPLGTNNIGEFLAIVHGLAELKRRNINIPVYSDSKTALGWIKKKKCGTKLALNEKTKELFEVISRAEKWLNNNSWEQPLLKWETDSWGEIPADFGRK